MRESSFKSREPLLEAALDEFCEINYENASLNRIIKNAKISKGTFYYHFKNKEELYKHILKSSSDVKWEYINEYTKGNSADFSKMDIFDKFLYQAKAGLLFANEFPKYNKLGNMFVKEKGSSIYEAVFAEVGGESTDMLNRMIQDAYDLEELDTSYDIDFIKIVLGKLFSSYDDIFNESYDVERNFVNLQDFVRFMKNGLKA